jgi:drug/metabolite transporter (DMT)-like permease
MEWYVYAFIAAILVALVTLIEKKTLKFEHSMQFAATLAFVNVIIAVPFFFFIDYSKLQFLPLVIVFFVSILGAVAFFLITRSVKHLDVSVSSPLLVTAPVVVTILAFVFLGEKLTFMQCLGIFIIVFGAYILELRSYHKLLEPLKLFKKSKYIHYIMIALLLYGITSIFDRIILHRFDFQPEAYMAFIHIFLAFHFFVMISVFHGGFKDIKIGLSKGGYWILLAALITVGHRYMESFAIKQADVGLAVTIKRMSALFVVIIGGEIFHEANILRKALATIIMIVGALLIVL